MCVVCCFINRFRNSVTSCLLQAPGNSLKLKQLKVLIDEQSSAVFENFSEKDAIAHLKRKVRTICWKPEMENLWPTETFISNYLSIALLQSTFFSLFTQLEGSDKFSVEGKRVSLTSKSGWKEFCLVRR